MSPSPLHLLAILTLCAACSSKQTGADTPLTHNEAPPPTKKTSTQPPAGPIDSRPDGLTSADLVPTVDESDPNEDRWGFSHGEDGPLILPRIYRFAYPFDPHLKLAAIVDQDGKWWYIDANGTKHYRAFLYDNGPDYPAEGFVRFVGEGKKIGFLGAGGLVAIPPQFDFVEPFEQGRATFCIDCSPEMMDEYEIYKGGRWGYVTPQGSLVFDDSLNPHATR
jgi:hypothetical protein